MGKVLQGVGAAAFIVLLFAFYGQVSTSHKELKEEQKCLVDAVGAEDMQKCFDLMDSHRQP